MAINSIGQNAELYGEPNSVAAVEDKSILAKDN